MKEATKAKESPVETKGPKVKRLLVHQAFTINGITDQSMYDHKGFDMTYEPHGIVGEYKGHKFIVPLANVIAAYL